MPTARRQDGGRSDPLLAVGACETIASESVPLYWSLVNGVHQLCSCSDRRWTDDDP